MLTQIADSIIDNGLIQLGFAGFSVILMVFIVWLVKQLLEVLKNNSRVMAKLRETINDVKESIGIVGNEMREVKGSVNEMGQKLKENNQRLNELDREIVSMREIVKAKDN